MHKIKKKCSSDQLMIMVDEKHTENSHKFSKKTAPDDQMHAEKEAAFEAVLHERWCKSQ